MQGQLLENSGCRKSEVGQLFSKYKIRYCQFNQFSVLIQQKQKF